MRVMNGWARGVLATAVLLGSAGAASAAGEAGWAFAGQGGEMGVYVDVKTMTRQGDQVDVTVAVVYLTPQTVGELSRRMVAFPASPATSM